MGMNNRLLRPIITIGTALFSSLLSTINGDPLVTQSGFRLRSIQDA